nr:hypothetical protein [Tanacetum cinerariifolium]
YYGHRLAMSSDNAQCAVTYMSISSNSDGPSWGIPLMNADELLEMDPYKKVAQQGQVPPLLPAYVPDPMKLDAHVPVYVPEPEKLKPQMPMAASTHALINAFAVGSPLLSLPPTSPAYDQAPLGHRTAMIRRRDDTPEEDMPPWRRFVFFAPSPGCDVAVSFAAAAVRAPKGQYDSVDTVEVGQGLVRSPGHDARTIARAAGRAEDVGALHASEHRMMTSIEEANLRISYQAQVRRKESKYFYIQLHDAQTHRRDIRLEIDVLRGQRTANETELQEVRLAYLSSKAQNRALLARLETLETHMSRMKWQR